MYRCATVVLACLALAGCSHRDHKKDHKHDGDLAEVVRFADGTLVVKADGKERAITFAGGRPHLHAADGKLITLADYADHLKPGVKVELEEEDGKVTEVLIKE